MVPLVISMCPQGCLQHCADVGPHTDAALDTGNRNRVYLPKWMHHFVALLLMLARDTI